MTAFRSSKTDVIRRLRVSMARALNNNPEVLGPYAPGGVAPTLVNNNIDDTSLTQNLNMFDHGTRFLTTGGRRYVSPSNKRAYVATANWAPQAGNMAGFVSPLTIPNGEQCQSCFTHWFMTDAPKFQLNIPGSGLRVIVDGQYLSTANIDTSTNNYVSVDFGSRRPRLIGIDCNGVVQFRGMRIDALSRVWVPRPAEDARVALTGDSHLAGLVTGVPALAAHVVGKMCGFYDCRDVAVPSTGYIADASGTRFPIGGQLDAWIDEMTYDLIGFFGGFNDVVTNSFAIPTVVAAALAAWQKARARQPNAFIVVGGVWATNTGPATAVTDLENALAVAFAGWADPFSAFIRISTDVQPWEYGTGNTTTTNASGNSDIYTNGADLPHYNMAGQQYRGLRLANAIREKVFAFAA